MGLKDRPLDARSKKKGRPCQCSTLQQYRWFGWDRARFSITLIKATFPDIVCHVSSRLAKATTSDSM